MPSGFMFPVVEFWAIGPQIARHEGAVDDAVETKVSRSAGSGSSAGACLRVSMRVHMVSCVGALVSAARSQYYVLFFCIN